MKRLREAKGLTQEQFAVLCGISQQYISGLERGLRNPTIVTLYELSLPLDLPPYKLLDPDLPDTL